MYVESFSYKLISKEECLLSYGNDTHYNTKTVTVFSIYLEGLHKCP